MKKQIIFAIGVFFLVGTIHTQVTITSPNGEETWPFSGTRPITWNAPDDMTRQVKLVLFKDGTRLGIIVRNLNATTESYSWKVGHYESGFKWGPGFKVLIRVQGQPDIPADKSDRFFTISAPAYASQHPGGINIKQKRLGTPPFVKITSPNPDSSHPWLKARADEDDATVWLGGWHPINWDRLEKPAHRTTPVKITLGKAGGNMFYKILTSNTPNDGNFSWQIPPTIPNGRYQIWIMSLDNKKRVSSCIFRITSY